MFIGVSVGFLEVKFLLKLLVFVFDFWINMICMIWVLDIILKIINLMVYVCIINWYFVYEYNDFVNMCVFFVILNSN